MLTEIGGVSRVTEACDWWSLGALLFELLTGMVRHIHNETVNSAFCISPMNCIEGLNLLFFQPLWQLHPAGIHSHTQLLIPDHLSAAAASLLTEVDTSSVYILKILDQQNEFDLKRYGA